MRSARRAPFLAVAIDDACTEIHRHARNGRSAVKLSLGSELYSQVLAAREREVLAGAPLLLLDLPVIEDATLDRSSVVVHANGATT